MDIEIENELHKLKMQMELDELNGFREMNRLRNAELDRLMKDLIQQQDELRKLIDTLPD